MFWYPTVGDDLVDLFEAADAAEASFPEFSRVGEDDDLLGLPDHVSVELRLHGVGGGEAHFEVDAVDAEEQFRTEEVVECGFGIGAGDG